MTKAEQIENDIRLVGDGYILVNTANSVTLGGHRYFYVAGDDALVYDSIEEAAFARQANVEEHSNEYIHIFRVTPIDAKFLRKEYGKAARDLKEDA